MSSPRQDFAVLLEAPDPVEAELARGLLAARGIPSMLHGVDRDMAELGALVHNAVARPDLLVPRAALEEARAILAEAWDADVSENDVATDAEPAEDEPPRARGPRVWLGVLIVALSAGVAVMCVREYFLRAPHQ